MSRSTYPWWGYAKEMIKRYPQSISESEKAAVEQALHDVDSMKDAPTRRAVIDYVFVKKTHTLEGAALEVHVSYNTARRYQAHFLKQVGYHRGLMK